MIKDSFMQYRTLGTLKVSAIGIGCMPMISDGNITYGRPADPDEAIKTIHKAIDLGITFFDTAEIYGPHQNEELVGKAVQGKRDGLVIATKFGFRYDGKKIVGIDSTAANIRRAVEGSLKRLNMDVIDLYYQHRVDPSVPIEEVIGTLSDLITEGKIKHIGLSEAGPDTIRRAAKAGVITALQSEYSIWERDVEDGILSACRENNIGFVPYSPLGRGFLTGEFKSLDDFPENDWRRNDPRYQGDNFAANMHIADAVKMVADRHGLSPAQVALAWLLAQGDDIVPIPGSKRRVTMEDSARAADVILTAQDLAEISAVKPPQGARYSEMALSMVRL
jgi:aryl-alcohol dehydrogenase-like predicted oxidoreductase